VSDVIVEKELGISDSVVQICRTGENWYGSHYELGLAFEPGSLNQEGRLHLLQTLWQHPHLRGVLEHPKAYGQAWRGVEVALANRPYYQCWGCIRLHNGRVVGCSSSFLDLADDWWFALSIPLGMLNLVYSVDYTQPTTHEGNPWTIKVDEVLAPIGIRIYREFRFKLGVLGEEASAVPMEMRMARLANDSSLLVPETFFKRMGVTPHGLRSPEGLWWTGSKGNEAYST
jgi:hypothetical protein